MHATSQDARFDREMLSLSFDRMSSAVVAQSIALLLLIISVPGGTSGRALLPVIALLFLGSARAVFARFASRPVDLRWRALHRAGALASGILFLDLVFVLTEYNGGAVPEALLVIMALLGAGATGSLGLDLPSYMGYAYPMMGAVGVSYLLSPVQGSAAMAGMVVLFVVFLTGVAKGQRKMQKRLFQARALLLEQKNELLEVNVDLEEARLAAESGMAARQQFLANMSHEIRTPLNGVLGMVELVLADETDPEKKKLLEIARGSGRSLLALLGDILEFSRLEAGAVTLESREFGLRRLIEGTVEIVAQPAGIKGICLSLNMRDRHDLTFIGDATRLRQVLVNLLGNAVKFTDDGEVMLEVLVEENPDGHSSTVTMSVSDTGVGIPDDRLDAVFLSFEQASSGTTRKFGGSGLGLTISRMIMREMGGDLTVSSTVGKGSTFTASVDLEVAAKNDEPVPDLSSETVVLVDSHPWSREAAAGILSYLGAEVIEYASLTELAGRSLAGCRVLIDEDLWNDYQPSDEVEAFPLVRIGSQIESESGNILRPLTISRIEQAIEGRAGLDQTKEAALAPGSRPFVGCKLLVAEDNIVNQKLLLRMLERWGADVDMASDGVEALAFLEKCDYDLILMDISMPKMDGIEAIGEIRQSGGKSGITVIALTAHALREDHDRFLSVGFDEVITKPVMPEELKRVLQEKLGSHRPGRKAPREDLVNHPV